ncbi:MAG: DUF5320 domain-containing protein [Bacteroidales bacterium]|nr:DUF5320 domain-containing protein [Bacteroidales bacterium]MBN2758411.1 DUF5320 domain-containing protein [Bacteroidales bacterium]
MPRGDKTGPRGSGPMTGRKLGNCSGNNDNQNFNLGFGFRRGQGFRHGYRSFSENRISDINKTEFLEKEIATLKEQIASIEKKLFKKNED